MTAEYADCCAESAVALGASADSLQAIARPGVELAVWQRGARPAWSTWLSQLPADRLPAARQTMTPLEAAAALHACCDAAGTPPGPQREAFVADVAALVDLFARISHADAVRLRLDVVTDNACRRWHRDCVPLRLICTCRGPGSLWVPPASADAMLGRADEEAPEARELPAGDVALFKGCGWPGQPHDGGIVHRSPRIAGTGAVRLVLVLDPQPQVHRTSPAQPAHPSTGSSP